MRRALPVGKALDDVLLAYEMNGETLPPDHGFPLRLVVPGWVGIASVKWLGSIEVSTSRMWSPWNTKWYPRSFSEQVVKSAFELPWDGVARRAGAAPAARPLVVTAAGRSSAWT